MICESKISQCFLMKKEKLGSGFVINSLSRVKLAEGAMYNTLRNCVNNYQGDFRSIGPRSVYFTLTTWACAIKHYVFAIYGFLNKIACLSKLLRFVTDNRKDASFLPNIYICNKLRIRNVL
jgi:hypothetical protein